LSRCPPSSTPFPYTTLFRSWKEVTTGLELLGQLSGVVRLDWPRVVRVTAVEGCDIEGVFVAGRTQPFEEIGVRWHGRDVRSRFPDRKSTRLNSSHVSISYAV